MNNTPLLQVRDLRIQYPVAGAPGAGAAGAAGTAQVLRGVDYDLAAGEFSGLVGESGSGKTQLLLALLGLNAPNARVSGSIRYRGQELLGLSSRALGAVRGRRIAMVFQDPMTALNPYVTVGRQITEVLHTHLRLGHRAVAQRAIALLESVHLSDAARRLRQYPHELSGGQRQRVMIAMALAGEPEILLADEPTTALDVTIQAQILALLHELHAQRDIALVFVTHDLGVIAQIADRVGVMYAGLMVEQAPVAQLFARPRHPYTEALRRSIPPLYGTLPARLATIPGLPPNPAELPPGCAFAPRCAYRMPVCDTRIPPLTAVDDLHSKACFYEARLGGHSDIDCPAINRDPST